MAHKPNLTPSKIEALRAGSLQDARTPGLYIEVKNGRGRISRVWKYRRRIAGRSNAALKATLGCYPSYSIADAREWATNLNLSTERGEDPHETERAKEVRHTVAEAHALYMAYVRSGIRRTLKPGSIRAKEQIWSADMKVQIGDRDLQEVSDDDLWDLVLDKGKRAPIRANRLAGELKVFMKWCAGRAGKQTGITLKISPATSLDAYYFPQKPRARFLSHDELTWLLKALAHEERIRQRAVLLILLTGCRKEEVLSAPTAEIERDVWTIPAARTKNSQCHRIPLAPWTLSLTQTNQTWLIASDRKDGPRRDGWCKVLTRIEQRMGAYAGREVPHFTLHDLRRTMRSNTKRLKIDFETAEAMLNHKKKGLEEVYDGYDLFEEKREGFAKWESFLVQLAVKGGLNEALSIPDEATVFFDGSRELQASLQLQLF
ncbi:site-specific integrase [Sphingobium nicotianae]|uniref:Integrase arm-type DNA-binding domain-containing protein n=1 Tax=Sphingobium nicotianae TaxID=2782607 RepID=A0A9X1DC17_9SPHN|nr:integrase arm-type DNA-binding domain-containing protein [Sphingobium nicotianae]MBT2187163.1 integrase arm-type DNA-binding domain-containing protein [Sphingobium nicotianae]